MHLCTLRPAHGLSHSRCRMILACLLPHLTGPGGWGKAHFLGEGKGQPRYQFCPRPGTGYHSDDPVPGSPFPVCGFWFGFVPLTQCQFGLTYQVPHQEHRLLICCAGKAPFPPAEQTIAPPPLASFPETPACRQERLTGSLPQGGQTRCWGRHRPPPCGGGTPEAAPRDPAGSPLDAALPAGPLRGEGARSPPSLLGPGSSWRSGAALVRPSLSDLGAGPRSG